MKYLLLTILVSAILYVIFKLFSKYKIDTFQAIVVNYLVCSIMGFGISGFQDISSLFENIKPSLPYPIILGVIFIVVFNFIALTSQKFGVSVASLADRINLIIPVIFAFLFLGEELTILKAIGVLLSIVAVVFAVSKDQSSQNNDLSKIWYYPLIVFIGGGMVGTILKWIQYNFPEISYSGFLVGSFFSAFIIGISIIIIRLFLKNIKLEFKNVIAGIVLGVPNFFSLLWLLKALDQPEWESSIVFPVINIGVLILTTLFGIFLFKEKLTNKNKLGLVLAIIAISVLIYERLYG